MPCQECAQNKLAKHTALIEREHDREVIESLKRQVRELEAQVKQGEKKKK